MDSYEYIFRKIEGKNRIWSPKDIYEQRDKIKKQIEDSNDKFIRNSNSTIEGIYKFKQFNQKENTFIIEGKNLYIVEN